jgi:hypothetical protein
MVAGKERTCHLDFTARRVAVARGRRLSQRCQHQTSTLWTRSAFIQDSLLRLDSIRIEYRSRARRPPPRGARPDHVEPRPSPPPIPLPLQCPSRIAVFGPLPGQYRNHILHHTPAARITGGGSARCVGILLVNANVRLPPRRRLTRLDLTVTSSSPGRPSPEHSSVLSSTCRSARRMSRCSPSGSCKLR